MTKKSDKVILKSNIDFYPFLDLGNCDLKYWPDEINDMDHVEHLNFGDEYFNWDLLKYQPSKNKGYNCMKHISYNDIPPLPHIKKLCMTGGEWNWSIKGRLFYKFRNLEELDISRMNVSLNFLSALPRLKRLAFGHSDLKTFKPVLALEHLESLWVESGRIKKLPLPFASKKLKHLHLDHASFSVINELKDLKEMEYFYMGYHSLKEIPEFMSEWTKLKHLILPDGSNYIKNKERLANCIHLETLRLDDGGCKKKRGENCDLSFISNFTKLRKLRLDVEDNVEDVGILVEHLNELEELHLDGYRLELKNTDVLRNKKKLKRLILKNYFEDISFLNDLPQLENIEIDLRDYSNKTILDFRPIVPFLRRGYKLIISPDYYSEPYSWEEPDGNFISIVTDDIFIREILSKGPDAIMEYFAEERKEKSKEYTERVNKREMKKRVNKIMKDHLNNPSSSIDLSNLNLKEWPSQLNVMTHLEEIEFGNYKRNWDTMELLESDREENSNYSYGSEMGDMPENPNIIKLNFNLFSYRTKGNFLTKFSNLEYLDIRQFDVEKKDIKHGQKIKRLAMGGYTAGVNAATQLPLLEYWSVRDDMEAIRNKVISPEFKFLDLGWSLIKNLNFLSNTKKIEHIEIRAHAISKIPNFFLEFKSLKYLNLGQSPKKNIAKLSHLKNCIHLENLRLGKTFAKSKMEDLSFIQSFTKLKYLSLDGSGKMDENAKELENIQQLEFLELRNMNIKNIDVIKKHKHLKALYLPSNQLTDISFLKEMPELRKIDLFGNQKIKDFTPIIPFMEKGYSILFDYSGNDPMDQYIVLPKYLEDTILGNAIKDGVEDFKEYCGV